MSEFVLFGMFMLGWIAAWCSIPNRLKRNGSHE